jgi:hypothetical protein
MLPTVTAPGPISTANRLLAVVDDPAATDDAVAALVDAGVQPDAITVLAGPEGERRITPRSTLWNRTMRFISFIAADQAVDLDWYRSALAGGRAVLVVHVPQGELRRGAIDALRRSGAHFINHYGRMATEDIVPWRGDPPDVHWIHHR